MLLSSTMQGWMNVFAERSLWLREVFLTSRNNKSRSVRRLRRKEKSLMPWRYSRGSIPKKTMIDWSIPCLRKDSLEKWLSSLSTSNPKDWQALTRLRNSSTCRRRSKTKEVLVVQLLPTTVVTGRGNSMKWRVSFRIQGSTYQRGELRCCLGQV